jgi:hypothetical protein
VLFLNTPPHGLLITAACGLIAFVFAIGGLLRSRLIRSVLSMVATFAAIVGTWWIHTNFSDSLLQLTPVFPYDLTWPAIRVAWTALVVALPIGLLGSLVNLSIAEE